DEDRYARLGLEWVVQNLIALRVGYRERDDLDSGLRYGLGVQTSGLSFDYAFVPRGVFQDGHCFTLSLRYGRHRGYTQAENDIDRQFGRANNLYHRGEYLRAYRILNELLSARPGHGPARDLLAQITLTLEQAETAKVVEGQLKKGRRYYRRQMFIDAATAFKAVLLLDPANAEATRALAEIERRYDEVAESIYKSGVALYAEGRYDEARQHMERVLAFRPGRADAQEQLRLIDEKLKRLEDIRRQQAVELLLRNGQAQFDKGHWEKALDACRQALALDPSSETARTRAAEIGAKLADKHFAEGVTCYESGDAPAALALFIKALSFDERHDGALTYRRRLEQEKKAADRKKALELNERALVEYGNGQLKKAVGLWENALALDPDLTEARTNLDRARKEMK
ncbi:MAG TPA: tetratricopeptide repeat protein, partial [Elusimicrobiota bacterium]|nr:tetratricopeptide repeat protein [Elusimicrobiota bacterium]